MDVIFFNRIDEILLLLAERQAKFPQSAYIDEKDCLKLKFTNESNFIYYLTETKDLSYTKLVDHNRYSLTANGWKRVIEIQEKQFDSKKVFVAMRFSDEVNSAWEEGLFPALYELGYVPLRN